MNILEYKEAKYIPENLLQSLMKSEIECWWSEPFSEYKICSDCKAIFSIEEVHGSVENFRNGENCWDNFQCLECNWKTKYVYKTDDYFEHIKNYIKWDVLAILLVTPEKNVEWFGILSKSNLHSIIYDEIDSRPDSYDKNKAIQIISENIFSLYNTQNQEIVYSNQVYVSPSYRSWNTSFEVLKKLFTLNSEEFTGLPLVWETRYKSKFYPISRLMWYKDLMVDKYWNVLQYAPNYDSIVDFFNTVTSFLSKGIVKWMLWYKKEAENILKNNPSFLSRKFYY